MLNKHIEFNLRAVRLNLKDQSSAQISDAGYTTDALSALSPHMHAHKEAVNTKSVERVSFKDVNFEEEEEDVFIINLHFSICQ